MRTALQEAGMEVELRKTFYMPGADAVPPGDVDYLEGLAVGRQDEALDVLGSDLMEGESAVLRRGAIVSVLRPHRSDMRRPCR